MEKKIKEKASYLRTEYNRNGGKHRVIRFLKITDIGITAIDTHRNLISDIKYIGSSPLQIFPATEEEYEAAREKVINILVDIIDKHKKGE